MLDLCLEPTEASYREVRERFQIFVTRNYQLLLHIKAIIKAFAAFYPSKEYFQSETNVDHFTLNNSFIKRTEIGKVKKGRDQHFFISDFFFVPATCCLFTSKNVRVSMFGFANFGKTALS